MFNSVYQLKKKSRVIASGWSFSPRSLIETFKTKNSASLDMASPISGPNGDTSSHIPSRDSFVENSKQAALPTPPESDKGDDDCNDLDNIPLPPPSVNPTKVLDIDVGTPDAHVPRDPRLIRLTGVHPFNVEAPLSALFDSGFLTPPELFYVRNHGAVPEVQDYEMLDWSITVEGLVANPLTLTLRQIIEEFEQVTLPVTLVCAGNRRKEQNQIRKSQGFSWGAAGVSTSLFTGPLLASVIAAARPRRNARYLCMEGADELPNGNYGTSIRLSQVYDPNRGIMLAHKMNGELLRPDHGRPLRVVVPSMIGGRSVKWLKRIILTEGPSENWYHIYDNRVLPTMVTPEMAKKNKDWWTDERYAIYDLSVNSAIAYPAHEEKLSLETTKEEYNLKGYAYAGAGRRITRVEISLDKGRSWILSSVEYPEDLYRSVPEDATLFGGRLDVGSRDACLCWCFWSLNIPVAALSAADDIVVRAMDDSMNTQPRDTYWSVLGMMHNSWFRVAIRKEGGHLKFEHPTQPALQKGGWMERVKNEGGDLLGPNWGEKVMGQDSTTDAVVKAPKIRDVVKMTNDSVKKTIEIEELRSHDNATEPWFIVEGEVYDGKPFLEEHPGGATSIISAAGQDATDEFVGIHSESAKAMMPKYHIGTLSPAARKALLEQAASKKEPSETFLDPRAWCQATLIQKKVVSWDTRIFTFELDNPTQTLGLPVGQHLLIRIQDEKTGEVITRPYTPISNNSEKGVVHLLVKVYFDTPTTPGGKMTTAMDRLQMGHTASFKGPVGKLVYHGQGVVSLLDNRINVTSFLMICGGSGITPIFQVLRAVLSDPRDSTTCVVLNGNRTEEDILCREDLDSFAATYPEKCNIVHTLTKPPERWQGETGRIGWDLIKRYYPQGGEGRKPLALICGPEPLEKSVKELLTAAGWGESDMVFF
ncbi:nitrate reductase [Choiromyces venosus 120613-1]|uniref:Nitrate reductase [NADPH] n=1 Tax=Choiromyces venosus 120613-1 TaxID=1336337 RepID=A0A3N4JUZ5_9PEZI|nr:nitrate reductase [Choiromyces venosus 120613-1]